MSEIKSLFVGQFGIVVTVETNASLSDASAVALEFYYPKIEFVAISYDGSETIKYVDESNKANGEVEDDMNLLPGTPVQINDVYYFGTTGRHKGISLDVSQEGVGSWALTWEYWNGVWVSLSDVIDNTVDFTVRGVNSIVFTLPVDWIKRGVNDSEALYYIRARVTTDDVSPTTLPRGKIVKIQKVSITGTITNPTAEAGPPPDPNFGEFTLTIVDGTLEFEGTYLTQARVTTASGNFPGKVNPLPVKKEFGQ